MARGLGAPPPVSAGDLLTPRSRSRERGSGAHGPGILRIGAGRRSPPDSRDRDGDKERDKEAPEQRAGPLDVLGYEGEGVDGSGIGSVPLSLASMPAAEYLARHGCFRASLLETAAGWASLSDIPWMPGASGPCSSTSGLASHSAQEEAARRRTEMVLSEGKLAEDEARRRRAIEVKREQLRRAQEKKSVSNGLRGGRNLSGPIRGESFSGRPTRASVGSGSGASGRHGFEGGRLEGVGLIGDGVLDFASIAVLDAHRALQAGAGYVYDGPAVPGKGGKADSKTRGASGGDASASASHQHTGSRSDTAPGDVHRPLDPRHDAGRGLPQEARSVSSVLTCHVGLVLVLESALGQGGGSAAAEAAAERAAMRLTAAVSSTGLDLADLGVAGGDGPGAGCRSRKWRQ